MRQEMYINNCLPAISNPMCLLSTMEFWYFEMWKCWTKIEFYDFYNIFSYRFWAGIDEDLQFHTTSELPVNYNMMAVNHRQSYFIALKYFLLSSRQLNNVVKVIFRRNFFKYEKDIWKSWSWPYILLSILIKMLNS